MRILFCQSNIKIRKQPFMEKASYLIVASLISELCSPDHQK